MGYLTSETFQFLRDLKKNNSKEWMDENRSRYKTQRDNVISFADALYKSFATIETMPMSDPKKSLMRINNNRRFQPDKPIYKTHFGVGIDRGEKKAGFYVHIEPNANFVGTGIYHPQKETLDKVRAQIDRAGEDLQKFVDSKDFKKYFGTLDGRELKTSPRDYSADHEFIHFLRKQDLTIGQKFDNKEMTDDSIIQKITATYQAALPFVHFLDEAFS